MSEFIDSTTHFSSYINSHFLSEVEQSIPDKNQQKNPDDKLGKLGFSHINGHDISDLVPVLRAPRNNGSATDIIQTNYQGYIDNSEKKDTTQKVDHSEFNQWIMQFIDLLCKLLLSNLQARQAEVQLTCANIKREYESTLKNADAMKQAGYKTFLYSVIGAGISLGVGGAGVCGSLWANKNLMGKAISANKDKLKLTNQTIKNNEELRSVKMESQELQSNPKFLEEKLSKLKGEINTLEKSKTTLSEKPQKTSGKEDIELKEQLNNIDKELTELKTEYDKIPKNSQEKKQKISQYDKDIHELENKNGELQNNINENEHTYMKAKNRSEMYQGVTQFAINTVPSSLNAIFSAIGQNKSAEETAKSKIFDQDARVFQQTVSAETENRRKLDAFHDSLMKSLIDLQMSNNAMQNGIIANLPIRG